MTENRSGSESSLSYNKAIQELEDILKEIEGAEVDIDLLSTKVERASVLLKLCRDKISKAETKVVKILTEIEENTLENDPES
jgi:exodeoxyribonuclease VII small subunit